MLYFIHFISDFLLLDGCQQVLPFAVQSHQLAQQQLELIEEILRFYCFLFEAQRHSSLLDYDGLDLFVLKHQRKELVIPTMQLTNQFRFIP